MLPSRVWGVVVGPSFSQPCGNRDVGTAFLSRDVLRSQSGVCDLERNDWLGGPPGWVGRLAESDQSSLHCAVSFPWVTPYLVDVGVGVTLQCAEGRADFVPLDPPHASLRALPGEHHGFMLFPNRAPFTGNVFHILDLFWFSYHLPSFMFTFSFL